MRRIGRITVAAAIPLAALATAAQAQLAGIPVYFNPRGGTGVGVAADVGFPNADAGGGTAYGVALSLGAGPITATGMVGAWKSTSWPAATGNYAWATAQTSYGASLSYRLFGGGLLPVAVAVQAGYGMIKAPVVSAHPSYTQTTIPVGIGISLDPPLFPLKPWVAPRVEFKTFGSGSGLSNTSTFHVSGGVNFNLLLGLGVHAAVDWGQQKVTVGGVTTTQTPLILSVGAHFNFHVPMM
jgi:hypothetical protein